MKKATQEWEQKYYEEKAKLIKILQADTIRVAEISSSIKPMLASKVETTIGSKRKRRNSRGNADLRR